MSTVTTNYNLVKPAYTDDADIADINGNMDLIDAQMKTNADGISANTSDIDALNNTVDTKQDKTDNTLTTTDKTVVGAINEHEGDILDITNNKIPAWVREDDTSTMVQAPGDLTQFGAWLKTQITANRLFWGKVNPTNSGYFGTSSFYFQANCSSANYGVALLLCDNRNKASMVTGQLVGGTWYWYAHQGTTIS